MPYKKRYNNRRRRAPFRRKQPYGAPLGRPPRMTRKLRVHQNLTQDCRWFKTVTNVGTTAASDGKFNVSYSPADLQNSADFQKWGSCWEEYKLLEFTVKFFPVSVGSESLLGVPPPPDQRPIPIYYRGNTVTWLDQGKPQPTAGGLDDIIVRPSAKLVPSRKFHKRWAKRPSGHPQWGQFNEDGTVNQNVPDSWQDTRIKMFGQDYAGPFPPSARLIYWYVMISFKVIFRGRQQNN